MYKRLIKMLPDVGIQASNLFPGIYGFQNGIQASKIWCPDNFPGISPWIFPEKGFQQQKMSMLINDFPILFHNPRDIPGALIFRRLNSILDGPGLSPGYSFPGRHRFFSAPEFHLFCTEQPPVPVELPTCRTSAWRGQSWSRTPTPAFFSQRMCRLKINGRIN